MAPVRVAVLDDYQHVAKQHFSKLPPGEFEVSYFPDTLLPYGHPDTPQSAKDALAQRLEPFEVICKLDQA